MPVAGSNWPSGALVEAFITSPAMSGFSAAELAQELAEHSRAFGYDPHSADQRALASLLASTISVEERQASRRRLPEGTTH